MPRTTARRRLIAHHVDKYELYLRAVQTPGLEVDFLDKAYQACFRRAPVSLREDFAGTFAVCCAFVKRGPKRTAAAVDLDPVPLDWGRRQHLAALPADARRRVAVHQADVLTVEAGRFDIVSAGNFSYWIFHRRERMLAYFKAARAALNEQGMLVLDFFGGSDAVKTDHRDRHVITAPPLLPGSPKRFTYHWEQATLNPITQAVTCHIHFHFSDGSKLEKAFTYDWRFWGIPEIRDLLHEAGFSKSQAYWNAAADDEDDDYRPAEEAPNDPAWLAYVVAQR